MGTGIKKTIRLEAYVFYSHSYLLSILTDQQIYDRFICSSRGYHTTKSFTITIIITDDGN